MTSAYTYDALNRLTQMGSSRSSTAISNYAYTLGAAGNRLTVAELSGRNIVYGYDSLYRLTTETVTADSQSHNFVNGYTYDVVGNRKQWLVNGAVANAYTYDADDRLSSDQYDPNGNTTLSGGVSDAYDFENHLVQKGAVAITYDGDGNRVSETVGGVTTNYLVDTANPTGYAQVVDELQNRAVTRTYAYGLERISENQILSAIWTPSFYGYDGHGSVRQLTNSAGAVTDTYDYDAFGNLVNSTGSTPNNYLFAGEQYDPALGLYYNRARYLNTTTGRFWSMDNAEGTQRQPASLHKYVYASGSPVDRVDPSGNDDLVTLAAVAGIGLTVEALSFLAIRGTITQGDAEQPPDASATSTNESSIEIYGSHLSADDFFSTFMSSFEGVSDGDIASVTGAPVSGEGQKLTFTLRATSAIGVLSFIGQAPFSVATKRYDSREHSIAVVTLQGHPLRGYRYWRVFSPDDQPGHLVVETGALDEPGPGPLDAIKFVVGQSQQLGIWNEYLQDALRVSGGHEGFDPGFDFPSGEYGIPSPSDVFGEVTGVQP